MPELIKALSEPELRGMLLAQERPVLLYLQNLQKSPSDSNPCLSVLESLARRFGQHLSIASIDPANCPVAESWLAIRAPALVLLHAKPGHQRRAVSADVDELQLWLEERGALPSARPAAPALPVWGAFYGDAQLRDFFFKRLMWHATSGSIDTLRFPHWQDGRGSVSAAMVHGASPQLFERVTGMPYSFACVMEFVGLNSEARIEQVFDRLPPAADLSSIAPRMLCNWLRAEEIDWQALLDDERLNVLRLDWLSLCGRLLNGEAVDAERWRTLKASAAGHASADDPHQAVQYHIASLLAQASPPPAPTATQSWTHLLLRLGVYSKLCAVRFAHGWTRNDFAMELLLFQWFTAREALEPNGEFTSETLLQAQQEWARQPKDPLYISREEEFHIHGDAWMEALNDRLCAMLCALLQDVPCVASH